MKFDERKIIKELSSMQETELRKISTQKDKEMRDANTLFFSFELNHKDTKGFISATYNTNTKSIIKSDMDLNFARPAGSNNYDELLLLAKQFHSILI